MHKLYKTWTDQQLPQVKPKWLELLPVADCSMGDKASLSFCKILNMRQTKNLQHTLIKVFCLFIYCPADLLVRVYNLEIFRVNFLLDNKKVNDWQLFWQILHSVKD